MTADPYTRCPDCEFIAPPESMDYALASGCDGIDWTWPVRVTCLCCHASHHITEADVLPLDAGMACCRCSAHVACPARAARVRCTGCGLFLLGPGMDAAQRDELRITEGLAALALRTACQAARDRPDRHLQGR